MPSYTDNSPLPELSLSQIAIPEDRYKADLELHDRFQQFGAELLRLSSAAIGVFGFLLASGIQRGDIMLKTLHDPALKLLFGLSPCCLGVSVAFALWHRFLASDGMFHHFRAIRLSQLQREGFDDNIKAEERARNKKFKRSEHCLAAAAIFLTFGAGLLAAAFILLIFALPKNA
jgi:hypothetical protein